MKARFDQTTGRMLLHSLTFGSLLALGACGGGGGGGELASAPPQPGGDAEGIGGTGLSSTGTINGTGSIFVNGIRFDVDDAEIVVNGQPASEDDLGLGMVVTVVGSVDDDGENGTADRVSFDAELQGPISSIERNADNTSARLVVLGQVVIVERTSTVFEDIGFDELAVGAAVEISGFRDEDDRLRATRVEEDDDSEAEVSGAIAGLSGNQFFIAAQQVDASNATLEDLPDGLANGLRVAVEGELDGDVLIAREIEGRDEVRFTLEVDDSVIVQGPVRQFTDRGDFVVNGLPVDASAAALELSGQALRNGVEVEISGTWNGSSIVAEKVTSRRGRIELEAPLADIDSAGGTLTLQFGQGTVQVATDSRTLFDDDRDDIEYLRIGDLRVGDRVEIEALESVGGLLATRVDRDDDDDETEIQAPVEAFEQGLSLTVLGLRYDISSAEFENAGDDDIPIETFFANLSLGALVKISDDEPSDGFAEEVEFEFATQLDGDRDFIDDDEDRIDASALPQAVLDYLAANFPGATIAFIERDDDEIEVYLADGTEVVFDLQGGFIESDVDDDDSDDSDDDSDDPDDDSDDSDDDSDDPDDDSDDSDDDSDDSDNDSDDSDDDSDDSDDDDD